MLTLTGPSSHLLTGGMKVNESAPSSTTEVSAAVSVVNVTSAKHTGGAGGSLMVVRIGGGRLADTTVSFS